MYFSGGLGFFFFFFFQAEDGIRDLYVTGVQTCALPISDPARNTVMSPLSIEVAFAMARAGARGETAAQIDKVLHFPREGLHAAFNAMTRQVVTTDSPPPLRPATRKPEQPEPPVVCLANGLFTQQGFPVRDAFLQVLASQYGSGVRTVDFTSGDTA